MFATYTIGKNELNDAFLNNLKSFGNSDQLIISVEDYDETEYLLKSEANKNILLNAVKNVEEGRNLKSFTIEEFESLINEKNNL
jgi:antitoxin YefM